MTFLTFRYPPLPDADALRLITLKPGAFFDPLEGDLVPTTFAAKPRYITLSYTWGDPVTNQPDLPVSFSTRVNDDDATPELAACRLEAALSLNGYHFSIAHNLALALRYVRSASHALTLWVDAICINQANIEERNAQVALMGTIYSRSIAVATWLGLNGHQIVGTRKTFHEDGGFEIARAMRDAYDRGNSRNLASWFAEHIAAQASSKARPLPGTRAAAEKEALERLVTGNEHGDAMVMDTQYWQRVWVVQEICLTQRVFFLYGPTLIGNEGMVKHMMQAKGLKVSSGMENMLRARGRRFTEFMRLESLIEEFAGQLCTETRDKIFGLVGLANDANAVESSDVPQTTADNEGRTEENDNNSGDHFRDTEDLQGAGREDVDFIIDYRRSFYDIWCDTVLYRLRSPYYSNTDTQHGGLECLFHDQLTKLVRFAALVQNTLLDEVERELVQSRELSEFEVDARRGPRLFGDQFVPVRGYLAGKIVDLGPTYADFVGFSRSQAAWKTKWRKHYQKEGDLEKLREIEEDYAASILEYGDAEISRIAHIPDELFVAFSSSEPGPIDQLITGHVDRHDVSIVRNLIWSRLLSSNPQTTSNGKISRFLATDQCMGLAPPGAAVGDWVVRFWNCNAAIIVRPTKAADPNSLCTLVGRADVADVFRRKEGFDRVANSTLFPLKNRGAKYVDMLMAWDTLQRITASVST